MNYIFLDIDGVLNDGPLLTKRADDECIIDTYNVMLLSRLVKEFNARIILSSDWRTDYDENMKPIKETLRLYTGEEVKTRFAQLLTIFESYGIELYGKTDVIYEGDHWSRPSEILKYVETNLTPMDNYVIFDDLDITEYSQAGKSGPFKELVKHFVQTNFDGHGLDSQCIYKATKILGNRTPQQLLNKIIFSELVDDITFERYSDDEKVSADVRDKAGNLFNITIKEIEN